MVERNADAIATRVTHRCRSNVFEHGKQHVAHFAFIFRRHQDDVGYRTKICDVEQSVMSLAIAAGDAAAIETKLHVQILDADVVYYLVETALQEGRIDRAHRLQSFTRKTGRERDTVLLGNTDVERSIGKSFERSANAGAVRHRSGERHHLRI